jgi:hypothetical protein
MKTADLTGPALDWAVRILVEKVDIGCPANVPLAVEFLLMREAGDPFLMPSEDWAQGGPIIERERINVGEDIHPTLNWTATIYVADEEPWQIDGPTPLIAAMRCYVASKLGDKIDVPKELL